MTDKRDRHADDFAASNIHPPALALDISQYQPYIKDCELSEQQAEELLQTLWQIMSTMVDIGWGLDASQLVLYQIFGDVTPAHEKPVHPDQTQEA